jgi:phosphoribosylformimino-5-aminoimidazole carboxamide ribotide isomerase
VSYVILGTAAVKTPALVDEACAAFPGHILVSLDAKEGKVAVDGWSKVTGRTVLELAKKFEDFGVEAIIHTDIGRDGMLSGFNLGATVSLAKELSVPVIASGGISNLDDIAQLREVESEGVIAAIVGRAIYQGMLDFKAAQKLAGQ